MSPSLPRPRLLAAVVVAGLGLPAGAQAVGGPAVSTAPGRIVFPVGDGSVAENVDAGGAAFATALPDGGALLFGGSGGPTRNGLYAAKIDPRGALDRTFGTNGVSALPAPGGPSFGLLQVLRQPDGKLLLLSVGQRAMPSFSPGPLQLTRLNADATLDRSFGVEGTAVTGVDGGCRACAVLQGDGAVVVAGTTGEVTEPPAPGRAPGFRWALTRVTPAGAVDAGFGAGGIATISAPDGASVFGVALGPGAAIVTGAQTQSASGSALRVTRLTPSGAPDPGFAGGVPVALPSSSGTLMLVQDDGAVVIEAAQPEGDATGPILPPIKYRQFLARFTSAGAPDPTFGSGGRVGLGTEINPSQLLPAAGGSVIVVGPEAFTFAPGPGPPRGRLNVRLVAADGALVGGPQGRDVDLPFGGGGSSFVVSQRPRPVGSLLQNSFVGGALVARPDGSYLVPVGVSVSQPTGEGEGFSIGRFAAAVLAPSFALDPAFGGPATPLRLSVRLLRQRARTARARHGVRVVVKASAVGLTRVRIKHGDRVIADSLLPLFTTAQQTLPVELTRYGNAYLRGRRTVRVSITATARDLLTTTATTIARGRLR